MCTLRGATHEPGSEIAGYRIESLIGRGGMAVVYRAEDMRLGRKVALKLLTPHLADAASCDSRMKRCRNCSPRRSGSASPASTSPIPASRR